jgi:hypothetical protein
MPPVDGITIRNGNSDIDNEKHSQRLLMALRKLEGILGGKAVVNRVVISLIDHGINLQDVTKSWMNFSKDFKKLLAKVQYLLERLGKELQ